MKTSAATHDRSFFPILVSLAGRKCVVGGAGRVAAAKIQGLLACGADVTVVAPHAVPAIQSQARAGTLIWRRRNFLARDLDGAFLAVAATNSSRTNAAVFRACASHSVLCNSVDDPEHCDFIYPAVARRGPLQFAISTGGRSPALAARLRLELEQHFGPEWAAWVEDLGKRRDEIFRRRIPATTRRRLLQKLASPQAFRAFLREHTKLPMRKSSPRSARSTATPTQ
ncbi:MAG: bifunctional precorrin-2 dehydrogenase/sirohydrochlorin ferrochelatase [Terracidiphilus sp.]